MGKVIIGVKVDCGAQKREAAGLDSDEKANLTFSFKFPGMTKHFVADILATGPKDTDKEKGDNPKEILEMLQKKIEQGVDDGEISRANADKIRMQHKKVQKAAGGGSGRPRGPGEKPPKPDVDYYGRIVIDGVDDVDLDSDNSKVDLTPLGIGPRCGVTVSIPGHPRWKKRPGVLEPGSPFDDPENPAAPLTRRDRERREKEIEQEQLRRRRLLDRRKKEIEDFERLKKRGRRTEEERPVHEPEPWEGESPYTGPYPLAHPYLPKGHGPWDPIGLIVVFLEPDGLDPAGFDVDQVYIPFAYMYESPLEQLVEFGVRLRAAGITFEFDRGWLMLNEYFGRRVVGLQVIPAREARGEAGPFPWHLTIRTEGPHVETIGQTQWQVPIWESISAGIGNGAPADSMRQDEEAMAEANASSAISLATPTDGAPSGSSGGTFTPSFAPPVGLPSVGGEGAPSVVSREELPLPPEALEGGISTPVGGLAAVWAESIGRESADSGPQGVSPGSPPLFSIDPLEVSSLAAGEHVYGESLGASRVADREDQGADERLGEDEMLEPEPPEPEPPAPEGPPLGGGKGHGPEYEELVLHDPRTGERVG